MEFGPIFKTLKRNKAFAILIILQIAITLTVMTVAVLVTNSTLKQWNLPSGLQPDRIIAVYPKIFDQRLSLQQMIDDDLRVLQQLPGVTAVSVSNQVPFSAEQVSEIYHQTGEQAQSYQTSIFNMDLSGLDVLGLQISGGRAFSASEIIRQTATEPNQRPAVVMISDAMAEALFGSDNAIGKTLYLSKDDYPVEIIGTYSNFMNGERLNYFGMSYRTVIRPMVDYAPNYLIRVEAGKNEAFLEGLQQKLQFTQGRVIESVEFLSRIHKRMYDGRGSNAVLMLLISTVLLLITGFGVAGLVSLLVAQQKKHIGIRRALGAKRWQIMRYYLLENSLITGIGLLLGLIITLGLVWFITVESGEDLMDVGWLTLIFVFVWLVSMLASLNPARRAAQVAPAIVTRGG